MTVWVQARLFLFLNLLQLMAVSDIYHYETFHHVDNLGMTKLSHLT